MIFLKPIINYLFLIICKDSQNFINPALKKGKNFTKFRKKFSRRTEALKFRARQFGLYGIRVFVCADFVKVRHRPY